MAKFIYQSIYCRYLSPGECVIWDHGGEFKNNLAKALCDDYGVEIRIIARGRPQANGIAESQVQNIKQKLQSLILAEGGTSYPKDWDETKFFTALQILRTDPANAHGFAPAELMIGRPLVFPMELNNRDIDFEGSELTLPLVRALKGIHDKNFKKATKKIKKYQEKYSRAYNKRHKARPHKFKIGDKVKYKRYYAKGALSKQNIVKYAPVHGYYTIIDIDENKLRVVLADKNLSTLKKRQSIYNLIKYKGTQ